MNLDYQSLLPADFHKSSKVWIYQSSRMLGIGEALEVEDMIEQFVQSWKSHGTPVKGYANLFFGRFFVLMADETATGVSGCSTDSSVRLIKDIEQRLKIQLFNREQLAFVVKDKIEYIPLQQLQYAIDHGFITAETLYFNNLVSTKEELLEKWIVPVKNSWLSKKLPATI